VQDTTAQAQQRHKATIGSATFTVATFDLK